MRALLALAALALPAHAEVVVLSEAPAAEAERGIADLVTAIKAHDARAIEKLLAPSMANAGVWFPDAACTKQFQAPGTLGAKELKQLAKCLARLTPQMSTRRSSARDGAVLTYAPGFEVELAFRAGRVRWIGTSQQAARGAIVPMLTAQAFEALRTGGSTLIDDKLRGALPATTPTSVWIETCLDVRGVVSRAAYHGAASTTIGEAFLAATKDWTFKPFEHAGRTMAVCSLSLVTYPAAQAPTTETLPPSAALPYAKAPENLEMASTTVPEGPPPKTVPVSRLEKLRLAGSAYIDPDPETRADMVAAGKLSVTARIRYCIDTSGDVSKITMVKRSGFKAYDHKLVLAIGRWRFRPYMVNNVVVDICAVATFMVTPDPTMANP